jgi:signal transduction histidine kinase/ligand-binding sensor domain-containing protein
MSWVGGLKEDRNGDLWIATAGAVCRRPRMGETNCYLIPNFNPLETARGIQCMAIDSDDAVWLDGGVTGIWQLKSGRWKRYREFPQLKLELTSTLLDREGGLWFGDRNHGLFRHIEGRTEQFDPTDGLSSETVTAIFEDREGSVWTATNAGLDRFRDVKVATISPREGLPVPAVGSVQASRDGGLWIVGLTQLVHARIDRPGVYRPVDGLPESGDLGAIFEDSREHLWLGVGRTLAWRENGQFHKVSSLRLHQVGERVQAISEDVEGNIWVGTTDPDFALLRVRDGRVLEKFTRQQLGGLVSAMAADLTGGMWLSRGEAPGLILALNGTLAAHADEFPESAGNMFSDSHGLWVSTSKGVFAYANGIVKKLTTQNGLSCDNLDAAIKDDSGALWLRGTCGLMQVPASELELWWKDPSRRVQVKYLDGFDGSQAGTSSFVHVAKTSDGRIWFALEEVGVQVVDPKRLQDNPAAPPVAVTRLVADHRPYPLSTKLRLPALTRDLEIDYTAYSLAIPEKVRFRYRLEGVDKNWQDVETRRQAYFTNLRPGSYRFAVSAANNDGVWNERGAMLDFSIAPAWYQTNWFHFLCLVGFLTLLWWGYQLRFRQLQRRFAIALEARVNERTRIARELHDTLLQSFNALLLRLQTAADLLNARPDEARRTLDGAIDQTAQALIEGRDAVQQLRSTVVTDDLVSAIGSLGQAQATNGSICNPTFHIEAEGTPRDLLPITRDEVYRIAGEALRNAFRHARARHIEVDIRYDKRQLRLQIRDDGRGIDPHLLRTDGLSGHYGLHGMRERAQSLGGELTIWSEVNSGTEIDLTVPSSIAYTKPGLSRLRILTKRRQTRS